MMFKLETPSPSTSLEGPEALYILPVDDPIAEYLPPSEFLIAVREGNLSFIIKYLLDPASNYACDNKDSEGTTALMYSIIYHQKEVFDILIRDPRIDINEIDTCGNDALIWAARYGLNSYIELLIISGASSRVKNENGFNAKESALIYGNLDTADFLRRKREENKISHCSRSYKEWEAYVFALANYKQLKIEGLNSQKSLDHNPPPISSTLVDVSELSKHAEVEPNKLNRIVLSTMKYIMPQLFFSRPKTTDTFKYSLIVPSLFG